MITLGNYNTSSRLGDIELKTPKGFFLQGSKTSIVLNYQFLLNHDNASTGANEAFKTSPECH